jgi:predicted Zn-dependent protease
MFFLGQQPLVPHLLLGPPFFSDYSFWVHHLVTRMTGISLHMQWPLTSQLHCSVSQREQNRVCNCNILSQVVSQMPFVLTMAK